MREIVFKDSTSNDHRTRDLLVSEILERNGMIMSTERHCVYVIKDRAPVNSLENLKKAAQFQFGKEAVKTRQFHVFKKRDSKTGMSELICRVEGMLYVVIKKEIFTVGFSHSFRVAMNNSAFAKE